MSNKLYIWGWWQGNNLGDNWIKKVLKDLFPMGIFVDTSVQKFEKNSFVICGGGGLFIHDVINPWNKIKKNINYGMLGLGAEFSHRTNKAVELYNNSKFFYVRDQYSLNCMGLNDVERSYDLTFAEPIKWIDINEVDSRKVFFVWRDGQDLLDDAQFYEYICPGSSYGEWREVIASNFEDIVEDNFQTKGDNIEDRISNSSFVISGRYHGIVAAIQKGIPFIAIDICPKIRAIVKECGLEEYCLKISEIDKLNDKIESAKAQIDYIRNKEKQYIKSAHTTLCKQIEKARFEILKVTNPLNVIHYGSYWMKENDVINVMADDLSNICNCRKIDLHLYEKKYDKRVKSNESTPNGNICLLKGDNIIRDIEKYNADAVILNSGGLYLEDSTYDNLKKKGIVSVGIELSDPDVFPFNGKVYADKFDKFYTNSKYSYEKDYDKSKVNIGMLPFAASTKHHYYMPEVAKEYDIIVVAHAREDRIQIVDKLSELCTIGTYGNGWKKSLGVVNGREHTRAINSGKMYLSFSQTVAGYNNVKVGLFEAIACNQVIITSYMEELEEYFEIGKEILCYRNEEELFDMVSYYLKHEDEREKIRANGYNRFLQEHTYEKRWDTVLRDIYNHKGLL